MGITYGDHLIDSGYHDITPEQEREIWAREECKRRGIDPDELCADGGVEAWMVVAKEISAAPAMVRAKPVAWQWRFKLIDGPWSDWNDGQARDWVKEGPEKREYEERPLYTDAYCRVVARERLSNELDPEMGFPSDYLLRCIHADIEIRGRKNSDFAVSVHHRNIVLSAVANALRRSSLLAWDEWLEHCGLSREAALNAALDSSKARDRALEEAAKLADEQCIQWVGINADRYWQSRRLAGSIRALKEPVEEAIITEAGRNALARDGGTK